MLQEAVIEHIYRASGGSIPIIFHIYIGMHSIYSIKCYNIALMHADILNYHCLQHV